MRENNAFDLIKLAHAGNQVDLVRALEFETRETHRTSAPGVKLSEDEKLQDEALWYARAGDLDEAAYRLSMI